MAVSLTSSGITFPNSTTQSLAKGHRMTKFTSSGTFTVPDVKRLKVTVIGGGGAGGAAYKTYTGSSTQGSAGGAGGIAIDLITVTPGDTISVTIGAGGSGTANPYTTTAAQNGGTSSFGAYLSATGGTGGNNNYSNNSGAGGLGSGSTNSMNLYGNTGNSFYTLYTSYLNFQALFTPSGYAYSVGGYSFHNFGGTPGYSDNNTMDGNYSQYNATGYGHGGSGATSTANLYYGGNGAPGLVLIEW